MNKYELIQVIKTFFNSNASAASVVAEGAVPKNQQQGFVRFDKWIQEIWKTTVFSFLKVEVRQLFKGGNYSRAETIVFFYFLGYMMTLE